MLHILKVNGGYIVIIFNATLRDMFSLKQHEYNPYLRKKDVSVN